jgi:hypothetical protein
MCAQIRQGRCGVFNRFGLVQAVIKLEGFVPIVLRQLNPAFLPPEKVRAQRDEAVRRIPVSNTADELVNSKDLLEYDYTGTISTRRQGKISVEIAAVERFYCDHRWLIVERKLGLVNG